MTDPEQLRALVVDDNATARAIASKRLRQLGLGLVDEADGGVEAILTLMLRTYDLVLLDWYMPDINGAGLLQLLRDPRFAAGSALTVILMTAYASADNIARAQAIGIDAVLPKPFSAAQLRGVLEQALGGRELVFL